MRRSPVVAQALHPDRLSTNGAGGTPPPAPTAPRLKRHRRSGSTHHGTVAHPAAEHWLPATVISRVVETPGLQEQRKLPREHHHEVLPARQPHKLPHVSQELTRRVPIRARPQPPPVDLLRRIWEARPRQQPSRRRTRDPGGCRDLVEDSGLVGLGRLTICVTKLVRDLPSRTKVNLALHQASLHHQAGYALKVALST